MTNEINDVKKELTQYLLSKVKQKDLPQELAVKYIKELQAAKSNNREDMAIIGLGCKLPDADSPEEFWDNIAAGQESIGSLPEDRARDVRRRYEEELNYMKAGYLDSVDTFDSEYFNIPPSVATKMDPYHRQLLQIFIETIEDAGYSREQIKDQRVGVFVGNDHTHRFVNSYLSFIPDADFSVMTGSWTGILASRLSYMFNLKGPATVLDTACSSSLVAMDAAIKSIQNGDSETAFIGGVNLMFAPGDLGGDFQSEDAKVWAFDYRAEGTVWGEGVAGIYIKPYSKAVQDRDHICGVIRGIAVNNDGASNGITAPNAKAQQDVLQKAWERADISPETLSYIETHGTGTSLGDSIEIKGLTSAFSKHTKQRQFCAIGSLKSNIGHTVGVAGLASLIKVCFSFRKKALPPSLNFNQPNPLIDFCNSPVYVQDRLNEWPSEKTPRRVGISSFGMSGTNSHMVVEEAPSDDRDVMNTGWKVFPVSGRTPELLKKMTFRYLNYLHRHSELRLDDICFTACTGREHHKNRGIVLCRDTEGLIKGLGDLYDMLSKEDKRNIEGKVQGEKFTLFLSPLEPFNSISNNDAQQIDYQAKNLVSTLAEPNQEDDENQWERLCNCYVQGAEIYFGKLFSKQSIKRCSLPPQVFNNKRYWNESIQNLSETHSESAKHKSEDQREYQMTANSLWKEARDTDFRLNKSDGSQNDIEFFIAWSWSKVLGYSVINPDDDFYLLGGDSILSLRVIQLLNIGLGLELSFSELMANPIFIDFVEIIKDETNEENVNSLTNMQVDKAGEGSGHVLSFPLSPPQNRVFLTTELSPDTLAYNVTVVQKATNFQGIEEVESNFQKLIQRHESLRTSFHLEENTPVQVVHSEVAFTVEQRKLKQASNMTRMEQLQKELNDFIRPFDLSKAPLLRVGYIQFEDNESYVIIDMHHVITDGLSMGILFSDYKRIAQGEQLTPLPIQYRDWVEWTHNQTNETQFIKKRQWWLDMFVDGVPVLDMPTDKHRLAVRDFRGSRIFHTIPAHLLNRVKKFAKDSEATLFMVLIAVFHNLLARLSGNRDIVIGTPVSGRPHAELQNLLGMFINTLPIRTQSKHDETFSEFLKRLKSTVLGAFKHQDYPYESLIEDLDQERDPGRNPLFDVYFALQNIDMGISKDVEEKIVDFESGSAKFDLTVSARETEEGLLMEWEFAKSLYKQSTVERMASHYQSLLASTVKDAHKNLEELELMEENERKLLLQKWNDTTTSYQGDRGIVSLFEEITASHGQQNALVMDDQCMSYNDLNERSNQIARTIIENGGTRGSAIALVMELSFDMIASIIGVLKSGCYYVPLDTDFPSERLLVMINDCNARLLLTHESVEHKVLDGETENLSILNVNNLNPNVPTYNLDMGTSGEDLAYAMYTSGSTGEPKGILTQQKSVIRIARNADNISIQPEDVLLQLSNYSFDGSVYGIFGALLNGASLALLHKSEVTDAKKVSKCIRENHVSLFFMTGSLFNALIEAAPECFDNTRKVIIGGEALSVYHVRKALHRLGPDRLINGYGPTETTVFATSYSIDKAPENESIPIGKAIDNTTLYVLDDKMRLQPLGAPGELYIGGEGLALGYLNQPGLTTESFVENPFQKGDLIYRTGDMVIWTEEGYLKYLGRRDQQIKLRGFRIELTEIERHALKHSNVREAYANVYAANNDDQMLCVWAVFEDDFEIVDTNDLYQSLSGKLPDYMMPNLIIPVDRLPLNKNGKVDKNKLTSPTSFLKDQRKEQQKDPKTDRETLLVDIWSNVLGITPGIDDNFFALGGDSIKAIQMIAQIRDKNLEIDMAELFQNQTVETLAPRLKEKQGLDSEQGEVYGETLPTVIQSDFLNNEYLPNHFNHVMKIDGLQQLEWKQIENALVRLCQHHDALRMSVDDNNNLHLKRQDDRNLFYLTELPINIDKEGLYEYLIEAQQHIDLYNGPLIVVAGRLKEGELYFAIHHLAVDVVSWKPILEDFFSLLDEPEVSLPKKTTSFSAWTQAVTDWARSGGAKDELPYWREVAKQVQDLPAPFPETKVRLYETSSVTHWIDGEVGQYLCDEGNHAFHTETVHLILSFLSCAINSWAGTSALSVNFEGHGREPINSELDVSRTVGWFTSTFPIVLNGDGEIKNVVKSVKESVRSVPRKGFGFGMLRSLTPDLSLKDEEMLECLRPAINFNYLGAQVGKTQEGIGIEALPTDISFDKNDLTSWALDIIAFQADSAICLEIRYPDKLFNENDIDGLLKRMDEMAIKVAKCCSEHSISEKTASDFAVTNLQQDELENILEDLDIT